MKKKIILVSAACGFFIASILAAIRIYLLHSYPLYLYSDSAAWFQILTFILWPSAFYLTVLQDSSEPLKVVVKVWSIAILFNALIYVPVGWLVWRFARYMELVGD